MFGRTSRTLALSVALLLALPLMLGGCGGGGGPIFAGTLEVYNEAGSGAYIVDIEVDEPFGPYYAYFFDQDVFPDESWFLDLYPSTYDVTLYWSDFAVTGYQVDIFDGLTTTIFAFNP